MKFCEKIKKIRVDNNLTQEEMASKLFISRSLIALFLRFAQVQASSRRSIALSGRKRSVIYLSERITVFLTSASEILTLWKFS